MFGVGKDSVGPAGIVFPTPLTFRKPSVGWYVYPLGTLSSEYFHGYSNDTKILLSLWSSEKNT